MIQMTHSAEHKAGLVHELLLRHYGQPDLKPRRDPLSELILTILSQNTADVNTGRAYAALRRQFPEWEDVLVARTEDVVEAIRVGGLSQIKAPRIQRILGQLREQRGSLSLDFLRDMAVPEARRYLMDLEGVGPKTAACVLLFSLHKPALPVDTHVHRVSRRVGLVPPRASAEQTNVLLETLLPAETYYPFHLNVIRLGRTLCKARTPLCDRCPLCGVCDYYQAEGVAADTAPARPSDG